MKNFIFIIVLFLLLREGFAQEIYSHHIRNYREDLSVEVLHKDTKSAFVGQYGGVEVSTLSKEMKYIFQGQEYDAELDLYAFPSRIYSLKNKRFLQVDPKSQYHSPYSFVGGDPVNVVDRNGNEGRPLFLYAEEHEFPNSMPQGVKDLQAAFPEAHFVPISDVVNGDVVALPEWNGNVYIDTHTGDIPGAELVAESGPDPSAFKAEDLREDIEEGTGRTRAGVGGDYLGERLHELGEERGVPVKNVFVGGCEGTTAAERMSEGFMSRKGASVKGIKARFIGAKKGRLLLYQWRDSEYQPGLRNLHPENRIHFVPTDKNITPKLVKNEQGEEMLDHFQRPNAVSGAMEDIPFTGEQGMRNLSEGRVPSNIASELDVFDRIY